MLVRGLVNCVRRARVTLAHQSPACSSLPSNGSLLLLRSFSSPSTLNANVNASNLLNSDSVNTSSILSASDPSATVSPHLDEFGRVYATGRRKRSIARVWIKEGSGELIVNDQSFVDYFQPLQRAHTLEPFTASKTAAMFDVWCTVKGGGISGQAGAVRLGISRALDKFNSLLRPSLRAGGFLTRDPRKVERKKAGQHKARKKYQWVKR